MTRRNKAMRHFKRIGLTDEEQLVAMRKLVVTWAWLDNEKENVK